MSYLTNNNLHQFNPIYNQVLDELKTFAFRYENKYAVQELLAAVIREKSELELHIAYSNMSLKILKDRLMALTEKDLKK